MQGRLENNPFSVALVVLCAALAPQSLCAQSTVPGSPAGSFHAVSWPSQEGQLADVNGDRKADLVYVAGAQIYVRYSTGAGFGGAVQVGAVPVVGTAWSEQHGTQDVYASIRIGDVDGNGRADIVFSNGTALLSMASGFKSVAWPGYAAGQLADVNGDRKADLVYRDGSGMHVRYSTGTGFGSAFRVGAIPVVGTSWNEQQGTQDVYASILIGDVDGDGRADIVFSNGTALLSTASGFRNVSWPGFAAGQPADINGDRKADLVFRDGSGMHVRYSTGAGFGSAVQVGTVPVVGSAWNEQQGTQDVYASIHVGDVDGNGRADMVFSNGTVLLSTTPAPSRQRQSK